MFINSKFGRFYIDKISVVLTNDNDLIQLELIVPNTFPSKPKLTSIATVETEHDHGARWVKECFDIDPTIINNRTKYHLRAV